MSSVTVTEVAKRAGASVATVSNVFNGRKGAVGDTTRQRILCAARELGYRPSRRARQVRKQANLMISVQVDSSIATDNVWRSTLALSLRLIQGINDHAQSRGYHLHLLIPSEGRDEHEIESQIFNENAVDGLVMLGLPSLSDEQTGRVIDRLNHIGLPAVTLSRRLADLGDMSLVGSDTTAALDEAMSHVAAMGHRSVSYIGPTTALSVNEQLPRYAQLCQAAQRHGLTVRPTQGPEPWTEVDAVLATLDLLKSEDRPTCLFYSGDHMAMAGLAAIRRRGLRVPEDISVLSSDDAAYARQSDPPLATIDRKHYEQGVTMAKLLLDRIADDDPAPASTTLVRAVYRHRTSLGKVRA